MPSNPLPKNIQSVFEINSPTLRRWQRTNENTKVRSDLELFQLDASIDQDLIVNESDTVDMTLVEYKSHNSGTMDNEQYSEWVSMTHRYHNTLSPSPYYSALWCIWVSIEYL